MSNNYIQTLCLNIHLISFHLPNEIFHESDKLRVGITTLPEHNKEKFVIPATKIEHSNHVFNVNVNIPSTMVKDLPYNATKKIIVSFRKKTAFSKPMIATAIIHASDFPQMKDKNQPNIINGEIKRIDIYEPIDQQRKEMKECEERGLKNAFEETDHHTAKRKAIGFMEVQLSLTAPLIENNSKHHKDYQKNVSSHNECRKSHYKKHNNATSYHHFN